MPPLMYMTPYVLRGPVYQYPPLTHLFRFNGTAGETTNWVNEGTSGTTAVVTAGTVYKRSSPSRVAGSTVGDFRTGTMVIGKEMVPETMLRDQDFTLQVWVYGVSPKSDGPTTTIKHSAGWFLTIGTTGYTDAITFGSYAPNVYGQWGGQYNFGINNTAQVMNIGQWYHLSVCRRGTQIYTHMNGTFRNAYTIASTLSMDNPVVSTGSITIEQGNFYLEDLYINRGTAEWNPNQNYTAPNRGNT